MCTIPFAAALLAVRGGAVAKLEQNAAPLEGAHGMRSRFLPVDQLDDETFAPRIVQVCVCVCVCVCVFWDGSSVSVLIAYRVPQAPFYLFARGG